MSGTNSEAMARLKILARGTDPERALAEEVKKLERADRPEPPAGFPPVPTEVIDQLPSQAAFDAQITVAEPDSGIHLTETSPLVESPVSRGWGGIGRRLLAAVGLKGH